jgi:glycosyltransferase involved in cell wall biosynthesis
VRVLVVSVVHTPLDARIHRRQIGALCAAGHEVAQAAPWRAFGLEPSGMAGVRAVDLPRAKGRRRAAALGAAAQLLRRKGGEADLVLLHDPELLTIAWLVDQRTPVVWDVHEDAAASLVDRPWIPASGRSSVARVIGSLERAAERRHHLLLAEDAYADRFSRSHPVIRNVPPVPSRCPRTSPRSAVVYVGRVSRLRGGRELVALGPRLARLGICLDVVGPADLDLEPALRAADAAGTLRWHGFLPNEQALELVDGALAGLSLLHDVPNYRVSAPTKVYEYLSRGVPVITTPLPLPRRLVEEHGVGEVVDFEDLDAVVAILEGLRDAPERRDRIGARAHRLARECFDWEHEAATFVAHLERWASEGKS